MRIALAADHAGFEVKQRLLELLRADGHAVQDLGTGGPESVDYPDFACAVARRVAAGDVDRGVLVCGTGIGMSIAANKVPGVRAAKCNDTFEASLCRAHNDANVLCLGARVVDEGVMAEMVRIFLGQPFEGGRHARRVSKLEPAEGGCQPR